MDNVKCVSLSIRSHDREQIYFFLKCVLMILSEVKADN